VHIAERIIKATWWERHGRGAPPDTVVVLIDADAHPPEEKLLEFDDLHRRFAELPLTIKVAVARWHLEAWFFADAENLRVSLGGRSLGTVSWDPDAIPFPKQRLRNLLNVPYTSTMAEQIASTLSPDVVRERSPSFARFEAAVRNGRNERRSA
jgi:hypothetical protein